MTIDDLLAGVQRGDVSRLVLADWLEEHGKPDLAELLRDNGPVDIVRHATDSLSDLKKTCPLAAHVLKLSEIYGLTYEHMLMLIVSYFLRNIKEYTPISNDQTFIRTSFVFKHPALGQDTDEHP